MNKVYITFFLIKWHRQTTDGTFSKIGAIRLPEQFVIMKFLALFIVLLLMIFLTFIAAIPNRLTCSAFLQIDVIHLCDATASTTFVTLLYAFNVALLRAHYYEVSRPPSLEPLIESPAALVSLSLFSSMVHKTQNANAT
jgi:hypothetical protein